MGNSKKFFETSGKHMSSAPEWFQNENACKVEDKSSTHYMRWRAGKDNAIIGDTVGDPLKDTSGPALNILVKLSAITSLVFASVVSSFSTEQGGPQWIHVNKTAT